MSLPMPRKPDTPCSICGKLLYSGKTSLPPDRRTCQPCRASGVRWAPTNARLPYAEQLATHRVECPCGQVVLRVRPQTYCSLQCAGKFKPRRLHICEVCTSEYRPTFSGQRTCGRACGAELRRLNGSMPPRRWPTMRVYYGDCVKCDEPFASQHGSTIRCRLCRASANPVRPATQHTCTWCAESFTSAWSRERPKGRRRSFCSNQCSRRAHRARSRWKVSPAKRRAVITRDGDCCHLCSQQVDLALPPGDPWSATLDHLVPRSAGGSDDVPNLALAHLWCNSARGVTPVEEARSWLGPQTASDVA